MVDAVVYDVKTILASPTFNLCNDQQSQWQWQADLVILCFWFLIDVIN